MVHQQSQLDVFQKSLITSLFAVPALALGTCPRDMPSGASQGSLQDQGFPHPVLAEEGLGDVANQPQLRGCFKDLGCPWTTTPAPLPPVSPRLLTRPRSMGITYQAPSPAATCAASANFQPAASTHTQHNGEACLFALDKGIGYALVYCQCHYNQRDRQLSRYQ